jgi:hypothetical protein
MSRSLAMACNTEIFQLHALKYSPNDAPSKLNYSRLSCPHDPFARTE